MQEIKQEIKIGVEWVKKKEMNKRGERERDKKRKGDI